MSNAVQLPPNVAKLRPISIKRKVNFVGYGPPSGQIEDGRRFLASLGFESDPATAWKEFFGHADKGNIQIMDRLELPEIPQTEDDRLQVFEDLHNRVLRAEEQKQKADEELTIERAAHAQTRSEVAALQADMSRIYSELGMQRTHAQAPVKKEVVSPQRPPMKPTPPVDPPIAASQEIKMPGLPPEIRLLDPAKVQLPPIPGFPAGSGALDRAEAQKLQSASIARELSGGTGEKQIISALPKPQIKGELPPLPQEILQES